MPTVAVVGASSDRSKYGNKAVRAYAQQGWVVYPIHPSQKEVEGHRAFVSLKDLPGPVERVSFYVPPSVGLKLLEEVAALQPREFFVNPGAESTELVARAEALGLRPILGCAILAIGKSPAEF